LNPAAVPVSFSTPRDVAGSAVGEIEDAEFLAQYTSVVPATLNGHHPFEKTLEPLQLGLTFGHTVPAVPYLMNQYWMYALPLL
jgi:hypothetical protein